MERREQRTRIEQITKGTFNVKAAGARSPEPEAR